MDKWSEELGARDKAAGNVLVNAGDHAEAVRYYTRAISLDGKKTVYYSNRAVALNALGKHALAAADCDHILQKDGKNSKAFYQRSAARVGLGRWREAESDLKQVLRYRPNDESAKTLLAKVKVEVAKLPKQRHEDVLNF
jgi:tetratricopeptide (TPR) repeat protein